MMYASSASMMPGQMQLAPGGLMGSTGGFEPKSEMLNTEIDKEKEKQARENHCEIERRRRVKMAAYFNELCVMVPACNTLQRKPDKLTILRMASSHMRNLRGHLPPMTNDNAYKPSFLTDQELKHLILEAADGFLFVAQCDTGNIIYVSDAVQPVLFYSPNDWNHRSLYDFVHPDDLEKVKDQLSTQENSSNNSTGRILDLKTGTVKKEGHPNSMRSHIGSRRSFICRIKLGAQQQMMDNNPSLSAYWSNNSRVHRNRNTLQTTSGGEHDADQSQQYSVVHITGYTKVWPPNPANGGNGMLDQQQQSMYHSLVDDQTGQMNGTNFHLIAIARIQMTSAPVDLVNSTNIEFVTRHDQNGTITFVDQRVTNLLGYQPADMLKKSLEDFCIPQDQQTLKDNLKLVADTKCVQPIQMNLHFVHANNMHDIVPFKTQAYAFCNPCNDAFEFIVCTHECQNVNNSNSLLNNGGILGGNGHQLGGQSTMATGSMSSLMGSASAAGLQQQGGAANSAALDGSYSQYYNMQQQQQQQQHLNDQQYHHRQKQYQQAPTSQQQQQSSQLSYQQQTMQQTPQIHNMHMLNQSAAASGTSGATGGAAYSSPAPNYMMMQSMNDPYAASGAGQAGMVGLSQPGLLHANGSSANPSSGNMGWSAAAQTQQQPSYE